MCLLFIVLFAINCTNQIKSNYLYLFNMQNVIKEATRITPSTETLIDVISTDKPELVRRTGILPLGMTDHSLVYVTLRLKRKRPPPTAITVRNFKQFTTENFKVDVEQTTFHIASVFDDMDDILWAWNQLFRGVCDCDSVSFDLPSCRVYNNWKVARLTLYSKKMILRIWVIVVPSPW